MSLYKLVTFPLAVLVLIFWALYALLYCLSMAVAGLFLPCIGAKRVQIFSNYSVHYFWVQLTLFIEKFAGILFHFSGDQVKMRESAIVIANHQSFVDWLMIFPYAMRMGRLGCCNFFAKDVIKWIPGFGTGIYLKGSVMLRRNWDQDKSSIHATFKHIVDVKVPIWLISHPEGTRLSPEKIEKSIAWSKKNDLPLYENVLAPRTKGLFATLDGISTVIDAVYDITIGYDEGGRIPDMNDLLLWNSGRHVHLHVRRFDVKSIPTDQESREKWINTVWQQKDKLMADFKKNGCFPREYDLPCSVESLNI